MTTIKLNLINKSDERDNPDIVICESNTAGTVAWRVIQNLGTNDYHPFTFPMQNQIGASDSYGNYTPAINADNGQKFEMIKDASGDVLKAAGQSENPKAIGLANKLKTGVINVYLYKDAKKFIQASNLTPEQTVFFEPQPKIWIGVATQVAEGQALNSAVLQNINTEINLLGIQSADIVMKGGGTSPDAKPITFSLENINAVQANA